MFELDSRLEADTVFVGKLKLCDVRLMKDANYPWVILVPRVNDVTEIYHLSDDEQCQLAMESSMISELLSVHFIADKMNVAALGNLVSQLHIHHVVRFKNDVAWPAPVWGKEPAKAYGQGELEARVVSLHALISSREGEYTDHP